jgi:hypothetical protein
MALRYAPEQLEETPSLTRAHPELSVNVVRLLAGYPLDAYLLSPPSVYVYHANAIDPSISRLEKQACAPVAVLLIQEQSRTLLLALLREDTSTQVQICQRLLVVLLNGLDECGIRC